MTYALRYRKSPSLRIRFIRVRPNPRSVRLVNKLKKQEARNLDRIVNNIQTGVELVQIAQKGRGIVAKDWFESGDVVLRYCGKVLSHKKGLKKEKKLELKNSGASFLYFFPCDSNRLCLDATPEDGTYGRLVNHSRLRPNCRARTLKLNGKPVIAIFAIRDIVPGEEVLYDYGEKRKEKIEEQPWIIES